MQIIDTIAGLDGIDDPDLTNILDRYRDFIDLAVIYIIEPTDTVASLETARGWSFDLWEFIHDHGKYFEAVFVSGDDGAGHCVIIPDSPAVDLELLSLCYQHATKPSDSVSA